VQARARTHTLHTYTHSCSFLLSLSLSPLSHAYVCMHAYTYTCTYVETSLCTYAYTHTHTPTHSNTCAHTLTHMLAHVHTYTHIHIHRLLLAPRCNGILSPILTGRLCSTGICIFCVLACARMFFVCVRECFLGVDYATWGIRKSMCTHLNVFMDGGQEFPKMSIFCGIKR